MARLDVLRLSWESARREPALEFLARDDGSAAVILGDPGAGKSSLARWLVLQLLDPAAEGAPAWRAALGQRVPLLIELRDYIARATDTGCRNFLDYLALPGRTSRIGVSATANRGTAVQAGQLCNFRRSRRDFRPTDAPTGCAGDHRLRPPLRSRAGHRHLAHRRLRLSALRKPRFSNRHPRRPRPWADGAFARVWFDLDFAEQPSEGSRARRDLLDTLAERPALMALAGNPLLLTLMAIVARHERLARSRVGLYRQALKVLCFSWDLRRELTLAADSPLKDLGPEDKHRLLQKMAWQMQEASDGLRANAIEASDLQAAIDDHFATEWPTLDGPRRGAAVRDMIGLLEVRNWMLTPRGPALYGFVHRTFLEHLCATELLELWREREIDTDDLIERYVLAHADDDS